ncbi:MAG: Wzz/FepE/Etk N-terminal domain-containing protein [Steroidobacteraceae bacterium]
MSESFRFQESNVSGFSREAEMIEHVEGDISIRELWMLVWNGKWIILTAALVLASISAAYAFLATEWWKSEVVLSPVESNRMPALGGGLAGLAALAGVNLGTDGNSVDAIAVLKSREFAREFIKDNNLLPVLFENKWDSGKKDWRSSDPRERPDERDGAEYFHRNVMSVVQDNKTRLVTLSVQWTDARLAAKWATDLVERINRKMQQRALLRSESNLAYLRTELSETNVVGLQQALGRLIEDEMQTYMLARASDDFAFRVIDAAAVPKTKSKPRRMLVIAVGTLAGFFLGVMCVVVQKALSPGQGK